MKPISYVLIWAGETIIFLTIMTLAYQHFPERAAYAFIRKFTGVIGGETWDNGYFLALFLVSFLLTALLIFIVASWFARKGRLKRADV